MTQKKKKKTEIAYKEGIEKKRRKGGTKSRRALTLRVGHGVVREKMMQNWKDWRNQREEETNAAKNQPPRYAQKAPK